MIPVMPDKFDKIQSFLTLRKQQALYRFLCPHDSPQQPRLTLDRKQYLAFNSNDYLGLANHPKVREAVQRAVRQYGVGSGASHLICGHHLEHQKLEEELAAFTGRSRALLFSTGYMANLGVINALLERSDKVFMDRLNHASLLDAALLSRAQLQRYRHNDISHLISLLKNNSGGARLIVADAVFSMDGDIAPVDQLTQVASETDSWLMLDDAHGFGCLGDKGGGLSERANQNELPIYMATLGKSAGVSGAFIAGDEDLIEFLIQVARTYIYTTAMPPALAAGARQSLLLFVEEGWRRDVLRENIAYFKQCVEQIGLELMPSETAIQPILIGDNERANSLSHALKEQGILVSAIRPPTVPAGSARLRISLSAAHKKPDIDKLLSALISVTDQGKGYEV